ncbi:MAG: hypothetical protein WDO24_29020 [Pseudomonadota bacterium]
MKERLRLKEEEFKSLAFAVRVADPSIDPSKIPAKRPRKPPKFEHGELVALMRDALRKADVPLGRDDFFDYVVSTKPGILKVATERWVERRIKDVLWRLFGNGEIQSVKLADGIERWRVVRPASWGEGDA